MRFPTSPSLRSSSRSRSSSSRSSALPALLGALALAAVLPACEDDHGHNHNENEVITSVVLTFTPAGGGAPVVATFNDADGDGGDAPTVDPVNLTAGTTYTTSVRFENRLETPAEDITVEVSDESDEHQIFFTGTAVNGPASAQPAAPLTHAYLDMDANGLPVGLSSSFAARAGAGQLTVTLRHLPQTNGQAVKTAATATTVKDAGFAGLGGSTDAQVTFSVTVP
jgi:hypothetical protein